MTPYSILTAEAELEGMLHGTTINQIQNIRGLENRTARQLVLDLDPQETKRTVEFVSPLFSSVYNYPIAADVKGNKIIDIFPAIKRMPRDIWTQQYNQAFDVAKQNVFSTANAFTVNIDTGIKTLRVNAPYLNAPIILNQAESLTGNGTWTAAGTATGLVLNNSNFVQGASSLQFNTTAGAAYLENSTMKAVDLSSVVNQSYFFVWVYVPTGTSLTSVNLRWGSSSSHYYDETVTVNQQSLAFVNGWNLCAFPWSSASKTGTPVTTAMNYARVTLNVTGNLTGCLVNNISSVLGSIISYSYYSKYLFRDATTGAFQETVTDSSNLINLDTESFNLYIYLMAYFAVQQQQGLDAQFYDSGFFQGQYQQALARYKSMYKSELQKPQSSYYPINKPGYGRYLGRTNP